MISFKVSEIRVVLTILRSHIITQYILLLTLTEVMYFHVHMIGQNADNGTALILEPVPILICMIACWDLSIFYSSYLF